MPGADGVVVWRGDGHGVHISHRIVVPGSTELEWKRGKENVVHIQTV